MAKVITFSRQFPKGHPKAGQNTLFVEQVLNALGYDYHSGEYLSLLQELNNPKKVDVIGFYFGLGMGDDTTNEKLHTIRSGNRWKAGDKASLRVWSGTPYNSPQIIFAPELEMKQVIPFCIHHDIVDPDTMWVDIGTKYWHRTDVEIEKSILPTVCKNDGLSLQDFLNWFKYPKPFQGQILCWKEVYYG
jgi:hypothetical protein